MRKIKWGVILIRVFLLLLKLGHGSKAASKVVIELSRALIHLAMGLISMFPLSSSNVPGSGFLSKLVEPTIFELSSVRL